MRELGYIYGLSDPVDPQRLRYVGQTSNSVAYRVRRHMYDAERGKETAVARWLRKLDTPPWVTHLAVCPVNELNEQEIKYIAFCNDSEDHSLLNLTEGGDGQRGFTHSVESRLKMSKAKKGKTRSGGNHRAGTKLSAETKAKISKTRKGFKMSDEQKRKLGDLARGRIHKSGCLCGWCAQHKPRTA